MTEKFSSAKKVYWTPEMVYEYLKNIPKDQKILISKPNIYCTENFTWNEVLHAQSGLSSVPSIEILRNLKAVAEHLQVYRTQIGKEIIINSSWRTPEDQQKMINDYNRWINSKNNRESKNLPSSTSLHLEGLAIDFTVKNTDQSEIQSLINDTFIGEAEIKDSAYTHIGLPTYSKSYLVRNGIYSDEIYRNPNPDLSKLSDNAKNKIIKRIEPKHWQPVKSTFDTDKHIELFKNKISKWDENSITLSAVLKNPEINSNRDEEKVVTIRIMKDAYNYEGNPTPINTTPDNYDYDDMDTGFPTGFASNITGEKSEYYSSSAITEINAKQVPITYTINRVKRKYPPSPLALREQIEDVIYDVLDDFCRYKGFSGRNDY